MSFTLNTYSLQKSSLISCYPLMKTSIIFRLFYNLYLLDFYAFYALYHIVNKAATLCDKNFEN